MNLPAIKTPTYEFKLISSEKTLRFRPFMVGEEKILVMSKESDKFADKIRAAENILKACCLETDFELDSLPSFDINYLFIQLRSKSVGESLEVMVSSPHEPQKDGIEKCKPTKVTINLEKDLVITRPNKKDNNTFLIDEDSGVGLKLKYISLKELKKLDIEVNNFSEVLLASIECIYDNTQVYEPSSYKKEELKAWIESIPLSKLKNIKKFFDTMPSVALKVEFECGTCGAKITESYTDFSDFF